MLGGGNPAQIPEMEAYFKQLCQEMLDQGKLTEALCNYDGPQGKDALLKALANLLRDELGWEISPQNIALTNGSQSAFFYLFNLFAGRYADGSRRRVLFPLAPEYIGYADAGLDEGLFVSAKPNIELLPDGQFKYHVDFEHLTIGDDIGMICVSRPTNPTGNVITDEELMKLDLLAQQRDIPLVIDNAYGVPFPGIIFSDATPLWNPEHHPVHESVQARPAGLALRHRDRRREGDHRADQHERHHQPVPRQHGAGDGDGNDRARRSAAPVERGDSPVLQTARRAHHRDYPPLPVAGALPDPQTGRGYLPLAVVQGSADHHRSAVSAPEKRGVLMVPGHYFFPGLEHDWPHTHQCMRMNYVPDPEKIERGVAILAEEIERAHQEG